MHTRFEDPPQRYSNDEWQTGNWKHCPSCVWQKEKEEVSSTTDSEATNTEHT